MLTDSQQSLILDAVDGELPTAQQLQLNQLLADSPEAAQYYTALKQQRSRIQRLPCTVAPRSIHTSVMQRITVQPFTKQSHRSRRKLHWLPMSIAASTILAIVSLTAIIVLKQSPTDTLEQPQIAELPQSDAETRINNTTQALKLPLSPRETVVVPEVAPQLAMSQAVPEKETKVLPPAKLNPPLYGFNKVTQLAPMTNTPLDIPILTQFRELQSKAGQNHLRSELQNGSVFKVDLLTQNTNLLVKQFEASFKSTQNPLLIDANTRQRIKNRVANLPIAIYVEDLTADQITNLLADVARRAAKEQADTASASLHLYRADRADIHDINQLLGIDLNVNSNEQMNDNILSGTIHELTAAVGGVRPTSIVVTCLQANQRALQARSVDLEKFRQQRNGPKPDCKPMLIMLRPIN